MIICEFHGTFEHEKKCPECIAVEQDADREMFGDDSELLEGMNIGCK